MENQHLEKDTSLRDSNKAGVRSKIPSMTVRDVLQSTPFETREQPLTTQAACPAPGNRQQKENLSPSDNHKTSCTYPPKDDSSVKESTKQDFPGKTCNNSSSHNIVPLASPRPTSTSPQGEGSPLSIVVKRARLTPEPQIPEVPTSPAGALPESRPGERIPLAIAIPGDIEGVTREAVDAGLPAKDLQSDTGPDDFTAQDLSMQVVWVGEGVLYKLCKDRERPEFVQLGSGVVKASIKWSFMQTHLLFTCYDTDETIVSAVITSLANAIKSESRKSVLFKLAADSQHEEEIFAFTARDKGEVDTLVTAIEHFRAPAGEEDLAVSPSYLQEPTGRVIWQENEAYYAAIRAKAVKDSASLQVQVLQDKLLKAEQFFASQLAAMEDRARYRAHALEDAVDNHAAIIAAKLAAAEAGARARLLQMEHDVQHPS